MATNSFLVGIITLATTLVAGLVTCAIYAWYRNAAARLKERESRLPTATLYEDLRTKVVEYQNKFESIQEDLLNAREEIGRGQAVRGEFEQLQNSCNALRRERTDLEQELASRKHQAQIEINEQVDSLRGELQSVTRELEAKKYDADKSYAEHERVLVESAAKLKRKLEMEHAELNRKAEDLSSELARRKAAADSEVAAHKRELIRQLENLTNDVEKQKDVVKAERDRQLLETQRKFDQEQLAFESKFEKLKSLLEREIEALTQKKQPLEQLVNDLEGDASRLKAELVESQKQHSHLLHEVSVLNSEKAQLEKVIPKLQQLWDRLLQQTGGGDDAERTAELWQPAIHRNRLRADTTEIECLIRIEDYLEACGLSFSERLVHAFHTALKVSDASPLVVLAGISGTGKSELPRRYAEAVGMNFLPMAVQPRWDSPQDMFGFFNYLENRFRATELGRALVQMDLFGNETGRGWPTPIPESRVDLSDQMLLILLDEMNLARVEYYFSDFLSKLETRRGIDPSVSDQRKNAELPLEIGRTGLGSPVMNIFVGPNVLFVGTMNEDETTQTLSDKVIDRANVIRFGSPNKLNIESNGTTPTVDVTRLSASNWKSWLRKSTDLDRERADEYIDRLNSAMSIVHRPFAHRTSQSIRAYIANYPEQGEQGFNLALADQIEQKLLPKFRGLDPTDPETRGSLDKLRDIIDEIGDEQLLEAVRSASTGHQFIWAGVDRNVTSEPQV